MTLQELFSEDWLIGFLPDNENEWEYYPYSNLELALRTSRQWLLEYGGIVQIWHCSEMIWSMTAQEVCDESQ